MTAFIQSRKAAKRRRKISEAHVRLHANVERQFLRSYRSWLSGVIADILSRLKAFGTTQVSANDLFVPAAHSSAFSRKLLPRWNLALWSGVQFEADWIEGQESKQALITMRQALQLPQDLDPPPSINVDPSASLMADVRTYLHSRQVGVWGQVNRTTHKELSKVIRKSLAEGEDLDAMTKRIQGVLTNYKDYQARRVARTETTGAMNYGGQAERTELGIEFKEWVSTLDIRNRGANPKSAFDHLIPDGQVVANDQAFEVSGERLQFPGDGSLGASAGNVISCRCSSVSSFEKSSNPPPKPRRKVKPPKPKIPKEKPPVIKPITPSPSPVPSPLSKKPTHLGFTGKPTEFSEKVWDVIGPDGVVSEAHARQVGKIVREQIENHPAILEVKEDIQKAKIRVAVAEDDVQDLIEEMMAAHEAGDDALYDDLKGKLDEARIVRKDAEDAIKDIQAEGYKTAYPQAAKDTLAQVRDVGYSINEFKKNAKPKFTGGTVKSTEKALENLPTDWVKSIEQWAASGSQVSIGKVKRGYFDQYGRKIRTSGTGEKAESTMLHEFAHAVERNHKTNGETRLGRLQREFLERRAKPGEKATAIYKGRKEIGIKDDFLEHYSGKIYGGDDHFEVLTTGIEAVFHHHPDRNYWTDADYMEFILGIIAGL